MVRTLKELNQLVKDGKQDEITEDEWKILNELIDIIIEALLPIIEILENQFGIFLDIFQKN